MNTYNIDDENFINSSIYQNFIKENPSRGNLRIRAFAASQAIPISGLNIVVSKVIDNNNVVFFEGKTDESGLIEKISLPAPKIVTDNLDVPDKTTYEIQATYVPDNVVSIFKVNMYENICVVQNINIVPDTTLEMGVVNGR